MPYEGKTFTRNLNVIAVESEALERMSEEDYREYLRTGMFFVDHHEVLRSEPAAYPFATTREQIDMLISYLEGVRGQLPPRRLR